jgi:hypothetical protein
LKGEVFMFKRIFLLIAVLLFAGSAFAQAPGMEWFVGYGLGMCHEGMQTSDGGYITIGQSSDRNPDMLVSKVDSAGNEEWTVAVGTIRKVDIGICVAEASDGYICGGGLYDSGVRGQVKGLVKLNKTTGAVIWQKTYGTQKSGATRGVQVLGDGSIIATGYNNFSQDGYAFIADDGTGFIMKTDSSGNVIWDQDLPVPQGTKVHEISGGFAVISCAWYYDGVDHMDGAVIETDASGNVTSHNHYGSTSDEHCYDGKPTSDGGYILAGHTIGYGVANWDFWLCKIASNGTEEWVKTFGQPRGYDPAYIFDEGYSVAQTPDGGYIMGGGSGDEDSGYSDCSSSCLCSDNYVASLVKTDSSGNLQWMQAYPCGSYTCDNALEYLDLTNDGGYIAFLDSCSLGEDMMVFMKLASDGPPDTDPPTPDPMTWASVPAADSDTAISMTATTASDPSGVEYYFDETSGNPGGNDSGWQSSPEYTDDGLTASTTYTYTVTARDMSANQNETAASTAESATTLAGCSPTDMHIESVVCAEVGGPRGTKYGQSTVTIYDDCGDPVQNALVDGTFSGDFNESFYDVATDQNGQAVFTTSTSVKKPVFSFTVDEVTGTLPHDPGDDLATGCSG